MLIKTQTDSLDQGLAIGGVYYGCSSLETLNGSEDKENVQKSAENFRKVICGTMKVCNEMELIKGNIYPVVSLQLDEEGKIVAISSQDNSIFLTIFDKEYKIVNSSFFENSQKIKTLLKK